MTSLDNDRYRDLVRLLMDCSPDQLIAVRGTISPMIPAAAAAVTPNANEHRLVVRPHEDPAVRHYFSGTSVVIHSNSADTVMNDDSNNTTGTSTNNESEGSADDTTRLQINDNPDSGTIAWMTPASATTNHSVLPPENNYEQDTEFDALVSGLFESVETDAVTRHYFANRNVEVARNGASTPTTGELARLKEKYKLPSHESSALRIGGFPFVYTRTTLPEYAVILGNLKSGTYDKRPASDLYRELRKGCKNCASDVQILYYKFLCHLHRGEGWCRYGVRDTIPTLVNQLIFVRDESTDDVGTFVPINNEEERDAAISKDSESGTGGTYKNGEYVDNLFLLIQSRRSDLQSLQESRTPGTTFLTEDVLTSRAMLYSPFLTSCEDRIDAGSYKNVNTREIKKHMKCLDNVWEFLFSKKKSPDKTKRKHERPDESGPEDSKPAAKERRTSHGGSPPANGSTGSTVTETNITPGSVGGATFASYNLNPSRTSHDTTDEESSAESTNSCWKNDSDDDDDSDSADDNDSDNGDYGACTIRSETINFLGSDMPKNSRLKNSPKESAFEVTTGTNDGMSTDNVWRTLVGADQPATVTTETIISNESKVSLQGLSLRNTRFSPPNVKPQEVEQEQSEAIFMDAVSCGDDGNDERQPSTKHARLTHEQVAAGGAHHIHELYNPTIFPASNSREISSMTLDSPQGRKIVLARRQGAPQAYVLTHSPDEAVILYQCIGKSLQRQERGRIYFAELCPAIGNNIFQAPQIRQEVIVKVLNKLVIQEYLNIRPNGENPYKDLARMEEIGDNVHVIKHIEALEDEKYLYIVMPKGVESLDKYVQRFIFKEQEIPPIRCHKIFCKIIQICAYLLEKKINHHGLSPDNFLFLTETNLVLTDFAVSNRIPTNPVTGHRTLIAPPLESYVYGRPAWMDGIVYAGRRGYDGVAIDLYAAGLTLHFLTTRVQLYERPATDVDPSYHHFIHLQGLWSSNEKTIDNLRQVVTMAQETQNYSVAHRLLDLSTLHMNIHPQIMHLLKNILNENPAHRLTLAEVMESDYVERFFEGTYTGNRLDSCNNVVS